MPTERPVLRTILHPEDGTETPEPPYTMPDGKVNPKYIVSDAMWKTMLRRLETRPDLNFQPEIRDGDDCASTLISRYRGGGGTWVSTFKPYFRDKDEVSTTLTARYNSGASNTLLKQQPRPRYFTPRECSRLMGFDAPGGADFVISVSDGQAYKQFGNAIVVPCVEAIGRAMLDLDKTDDGDYADDNLSLW